MQRSILITAPKWLAALLFASVMAAVLLIALFGWNWMRAPIERYTLEKTGRVLRIDGDLTVQLGWPQMQLQAAGITFANPDWAQERQMVSAQNVGVTLDLSQLLHRQVALPEVRLDNAAVFLEQTGDGRKSWLMDLGQQDEEARVQIGRIVLDHGSLGYDDASEKTRIRSELSTGKTAELQFTAQGQFRGQPVKARGSGGPVLALRDTDEPYPLKVDATMGRTQVQAEGSVTGLTALRAVDMRMRLRGDSLEQLYPLLGIAFPATRAYSTEGRLRHADHSWRFEQFSGRIGGSDIAGWVEVVTGGARPVLTGDLRSQMLALDDLGPLIGARPGSVAQAKAQPAVAGPARVLPQLPFHAERWDSVDADVKLQAKTIARAKELPLEDLQVHLRMQDAMLTLDPLNFGFAGGELQSKITLNGKNNPINAKAQLRARKLQLSKLLPTVELAKSSLGELNGDIELAGRGNSVAGMLGGADGRLSMVVSGGQISRLMMEKAGLHVWEIVTLSLAGDQQVQLRCVVADFDVRQGVMKTNALVLDTQVTTLQGSGSIDLAQEQLNMLLNQRTKNTSPLALRAPIYVRGNFAQPAVGVDKSAVALRAAGAVALGLVNPLLALIPLVDAGPGEDSDCGRLVRETKAPASSAKP